MQRLVDQAPTWIQRHLFDSADVKRRTVEACTDAIIRAAMLMIDAFQVGGKVLLCGNGGSAADCQHVATELVSRLTRDFERQALPALALTTDTSFLTAYGNDCGFDGVFARQIHALGRPGDVLVGISTSGNSINVLRAVEMAQSLGMGTIVLTGNGGALVEKANIVIAVPSDDTQYIQETHLAVEHVLCQLIEASLFGRTYPAGMG